MKIIIDIPDEIRKLIFDGVYCGIIDKRVYNAIKNGVPITEENGIDNDYIIAYKCGYNCGYSDAIYVMSEENE